MIAMLFGDEDFFQIRRSWISSLSLSIFAGRFGTYLLNRGIKYRGNF